MLHGMVIQTKDNNKFGENVVNLPLLRGHGSSSLYHSKFFMPKNSIEARWNSAMSWGGKDRTGVDPELL